MALFSSKESAPARPAPRPDLPAVSGASMIGPNLVVEGKLSGTETLTVEGTVKGEINLQADLRVGPRARIEAKVHAKNVTVEGKLTGDISADERVELVASAAVDGNIKAPKIIVAEGARFRGSVDMGSSRPKDADPAHPAPVKG